MKTQPTEQPRRGGAASGRPEDGSGEGRKEVTGIMPPGIRVDPDITEGHPGYDESGSSELRPPSQPSGSGTPNR
jgi:hypothetical protein